jgi:hypothetical protein
MDADDERDMETVYTRVREQEENPRPPVSAFPLPFVGKVPSITHSLIAHCSVTSEGSFASWTPFPDFSKSNEWIMSWYPCEGRMLVADGALFTAMRLRCCCCAAACA